MKREIEATPEERAYHSGWMSFFDEDIIENPYDSQTEAKLFEMWGKGRRSAEITNKIMLDV